MTSLENLPNVHLLGELPYSVLPQYLHVFDVGIIPFKKQPLTEATNPVKMFEYMSAGKPVVATELDEIRYFAGHVRLASTSQEWLDSIEGALVDTSPQSIYDRINFARQNTWQERVNRIKRAIQAIYPRVSIIVVTYNNADYTRLCLQSLSEKSGYPHFELVVVDNASQDGTQEYLKAFAQSHPDVKLVLNEANEGFARGNNLGAAVASGDYLIFLNNDTVVTPGWISGLLKHLQDGTIGIVGPVTNWAGNESQIPVDYHSLQDLDEFAARYTAGHARQTTHLRVLPFFCVALRRSTFNLVGPLDERFGLGMFEDDDYALRVRQKGLKVICAEDVFIHHWGRTTFAQIDPQAYQQLFEDNRQKFEQKWGVTWEPHRYRWLS